MNRGATGRLLPHVTADEKLFPKERHGRGFEEKF